MKQRAIVNYLGTLHRRIPYPLKAVLLCLPLVNCAGTAAMRECTAILRQDSVETSLPRLQQIMRQEPRSGECTQAYLLASSRQVASYMAQAERMSAAGQYAEAGPLYRNVLDIQPGNDLARQGLRQIEQLERQRSLMNDARQAVSAKDWTQARGATEALLRAAPGNVEAMGLQAEIARQTAPPPADPGLLAAFKKPISIEFRDVALRQVFEVVSRSSGLNFVFDKDVKADQKTSIFLRDSTVESALYFLLLTNQLEHQVLNGNTVVIYPNSPAKQKEYQELSVRTFQMANTDVRSVAAAIKTLFKGRDFVVDEKQNMLVVRDTPDAIRVIEKLVALHDIAEPEVMLEVAVLEVSRKKLLNLGVELPGSLALTPLASSAATGLTLQDLRDLNGSRLGATINGVTINAQKQDTDVNLLANPRIRVVNREKARVLIGDRWPVITVTTSPTGGYAESVNYVDVGLKLDVEPTIYRGNDIVIKIALEVSNISGSTVSKLGGTSYTFGTRTANTTLRLRDGENQILAGLINDEDRRTASKVPGIGELPVLGRLFGTALDDGNKTEIMLSITPRLVRNAYRAEGGAIEFRSGTESSMRERPSIAGRVQVPMALPQAGGPAAAVPAAPAPPAAISPASVPAPVTPSAPQVPAAPAPPPAQQPPAASAPAASMPAVSGVPVVNLGQGVSSMSSVGLAGKSTQTRADEGGDAK